VTEDLTGLRFGNLLVLRLEGANKHGFRQFLCRCITPLNDIANDRIENELINQNSYCGKEFLVNAGSLKQSLKKLDQRKVTSTCKLASLTPIIAG